MAAERQLNSPSGVHTQLRVGSAFTSIPALAFVGRADEALAIAYLNINNKIVSSSKIREHPTLVSATQMFGACKTEMDIQTVPRALQADVRKRLLTECKLPRTS